MSPQFEYDEIGNVSFHNLLNAAMPVIGKKHFANVGDDELIYYAQLVQYKVQRDLFILSEEAAPGTIFWEDFVLLMRGRKELRDICMDVICQKVETAFFQYNFTQKELDCSRIDDLFDVDTLRGARLFSDDEGLMLMRLFLYFAEQAHLNHLQDTTRPDYIWEEYYNDLFLDHGLWKEVLIAFRNTILRLDFKEDWQKVEFDFE